jgi:hypothetical protein
MASYTNSLRLTLPVTGTEDGTWGDTVNNGITTLIDTSIAGTAAITMIAANYTLTSNSGATDEARSMFLTLGGTPGASFNVICPTKSKLYFVKNNTAFAQTVKTLAGTGISVPNGGTITVLYCDGTNVVNALTQLSSLTLGSALPVTSGGTGGTTQAAGRTGLGATTLGANLFTVTNPSAVTFPRFNADNTVSSLDAASFRTAIGAGSGAGTVTSVAATVPTFLSVSGSPITTSGTLAISLSGTALPVANGGTGATTLTANNVILGNNGSAVQVVAPSTSGNVLTSNGTTWVSQAAGASLSGVTQSVSPFETSLGFEAGLNTTGVNNTFTGYQAGKANTSGANNTAVGYQALDANTTGAENVAMGRDALGANTTGNQNTAFGNNALLENTTGGANAAFGREALRSNTTANYNSAFGVSALYSATGASNSAFGTGAVYGSLGQVSTGTNNTAIGFESGDQVTTGTQNVILGAGAASSGTNDLTTGSNNIVIGYDAEASSATVSDEVTIGNASIATLRCQVTTITSLSDERDKTNIVDLGAGLNLINAVRPVAFDWNMRDGGKVGEHDTGFIAQELQAAQVTAGVNIPGLVFDANPEKLEAGYGKLLPVMVKAIQELSAKVDALQAELNQLKGT